MPLCPLELYALAMLKADGFYMHDIVLSLLQAHNPFSQCLSPQPAPTPMVPAYLFGFIPTTKEFM